MNRSAHHRFQDLLLRYSQEGDARQRSALETEIWSEYGMQQAVLVLDMSGFSQLTGRFGIVHYLSMVRRMQLTAEPIIRSFGGELIKFEADNCFAMFGEVAGAVRASIAMNLAFDAANEMTPDALDIRIACGIDYGQILVIDRGDFFGDAVNRASKLGEDLAKPGEILLSEAAYARCEGIDDLARWQASPVELEISGIRIVGRSILMSEQAVSPEIRRLMGVG